MRVDDLVGKGLTPFFSIIVPASGAKSQAAPATVPLINNDDIKNKIYSLKVEEKEGQGMTVMLSIMDDTGRINKKYSYGVKTQVTWGLRQSAGLSIDSLIRPKIAAVKEIKGSMIRGPVDCHMMNYSVAGQDGIAIASLTFRAGNQAGFTPQTRIFTGMTAGYAISLVALDLGFIPEIAFPDSGEVLTQRNALRQNNESSMSFLRRMAFKYNCKLTFQTDPPKMYFIAWERDKEINYPESRGLEGVVHKLDYGSINSTIMSFSIDMNSGPNNGSTISIVTGPDGTSQATFSPSPTESTEIWEIDQDKIKAALKARKFKDQAALVAEIQSAGFQDLDKLKKLYFTKRTTTTAPEGSGYTCKAKIIPNPLMQVGDRVFLGSEASLIPPQFKSRFKNATTPDDRTLWRITSITQTIDASNYAFEIEMAR